jgi:PAS domain S-box-containing protein
MSRPAVAVVSRPSPKAAPNPGAHFAALAEQLDEAVFVVTPGTGLVQYANLKAAEITGYSRDELARMSLAEIIAVAEAPDSLERIHGAANGPSRSLLNVPLKTSSGKVCLVDLRVGAALGAAPYRRGSDGPVLMVLARLALARTNREQEDAQRLRALGALQRLAAGLPNPEAASLQDVLAECAIALDADGVAAYAVVADPLGLALSGGVNLPPGFPSQIGAGEAGVCLTPLAWQSGQRPDSALTRAARAAGWSSLITQPLTDANASTGLVLAGYRPGRAAPREALETLGLAARLVATLLTHQARARTRRRVELHAADLARQLETILDATADGVITLDTDGLITEVNTAGQRLLGYRAEEVAGSRAEDVLVSPQPLGEALQRAAAEGRPADDQDVELVRRDGRTFPARLRAMPVADAAGEPAGAVVVITDLTLVKTYERQHLHLEQRAYLGDTSAIFAHEIRNPLNGIGTGLELIALRLPEGDPLQETVAKIQAEADRIEQLLKQVLLVVKPTEIEFEPVEAHRLIERVLLRLGPRLQRRYVEVARHYVPDTPLGRIDARMLEQVFVNLIENASQAMGGSGGTLTVTVGPASKSALASGAEADRDFAAGGGREFIQIDISDTGPGIPAESLRHIFEPFYTTKGEGTGLGLAIAKRIVHLHRGSLTVQSWPSVGTVFTILIPAAGQP